MWTTLLSIIRSVEINLHTNILKSVHIIFLFTTIRLDLGSDSTFLFFFRSFAQSSSLQLLRNGNRFCLGVCFSGYVQFRAIQVCFRLLLNQWSTSSSSYALSGEMRTKKKQFSYFWAWAFLVNTRNLNRYLSIETWNFVAVFLMQC